MVLYVKENKIQKLLKKTIKTNTPSINTCSLEIFSPGSSTPLTTSRPYKLMESKIVRISLKSLRNPLT